MTLSARLVRQIIALFIFGFSLWMWTKHSDVIRLIVLQRPVLFGRYSQGHFGALLILTPILWAIAAAVASRRPLKQALGNAGISIATTLIAVLVITYVAHFFRDGPRYIETKLDDNEHAMQLAGAVRHRPPNQVYDMTYVDKPEQARSYPNPPAGYPDIPLRLTTDANGFRNLDALPQYDMLAVGDSFVAGSNISDDQTWSALLAKATNQTIYNLGVGGSGPPTYLSNYVYFGLKLKPRVALFMIYEGNDFKEDVVLVPTPSASSESSATDKPSAPPLTKRIGEHFSQAFDSSPVTKGLKRLSQDLLEKLGSTRPVPHYQEKLGFMPIAITHENTTQYYSFDPKRVVYLNYSKDEFTNSPEWQATAKILEHIIALSREHNIKPVFIYAPSTPHVVLPLVKEKIPAEQLHYFISRKQKHLPTADELKRQIYDNLDTEQNVVLELCRAQNIDCVALTAALQRETANGVQTYFTYDQHWTPDGQRIAAEVIEQFLREKGYL
ncbi:MAG: SGNH/GDSL hydrolase family protein [Spongiibacteraceae bacterium]